tara:strand:- start:4419 stop:4997 length:579 start_codon:yes stop_codon:yes gene_type:complete
MSKSIFQKLVDSAKGCEVNIHGLERQLEEAKEYLVKTHEGIQRIQDCPLCGDVSCLSWYTDAGGLNNVNCESCGKVVEVVPGDDLFDFTFREPIATLWLRRDGVIYASPCMQGEVFAIPILNDIATDILDSLIVLIGKRMQDDDMSDAYFLHPQSVIEGIFRNWYEPEDIPVVTAWVREKLEIVQAARKVEA